MQTTMAGRTRPWRRHRRPLFSGVRPAAAYPAIEPEVLEAPGIVDAVDLRGQPLELRPAAVRGLVVKKNRAGIVLDQLLLDLPDHLFALIDVGLRRLLVDQLVNLVIAVG